MVLGSRQPRLCVLARNRAFRGDSHSLQQKRQRAEKEVDGTCKQSAGIQSRLTAQKGMRAHRHNAANRVTERSAASGHQGGPATLGAYALETAHQL